jgi:hypothetical protein
LSRARLARALVAISLVAGGVAGNAPPAHAHAVTGVKPTNYKSEIVGISGPAGPVGVRLLDLGRRIELVNRGRADIVVLGYAGEAWLRVGPRGGFENAYSNSAYQERQRPGQASAPPPDPAKASGPPRWRRTSDRSTVIWRDRRTRFDGPAPDAVLRAPGQGHPVVPRWTVDLRRGAVTLSIEGRIRYVPPPSPVSWALVAIALFVATVVTVRFVRVTWVLGQCLALLVAVDVVHSFANAAVSGGSLATQAAGVLGGGSLAVVAWVLGATAISMLGPRTELGIFLAGSAALIIAVYGGVTDAAVLSTSQVPSALSPFLSRAAVALSLGVGFGIAGALAYEGMRGPTSDTRSDGPRRATTVRP